MAERLDAKLQAEHDFAWKTAKELAIHIQNGGRPAVVPPTVFLQPGESQHGLTTLEMSQFYGMDVAYSTEYSWQGGPILGAATMAASMIGNSVRKSRAEALARPQWRLVGFVPTVVTDRRLLMCLDGQWISLYIDYLVQIVPEPSRWSVVMMFEGADAMMLRGPWAPWLSVLVCSLRFGLPWVPGSDYRSALGITQTRN